MKYEYMQFKGSDKQSDVEWLNHLGQQGWVMTGCIADVTYDVFTPIFFMMRALPEDSIKE